MGGERISASRINGSEILGNETVIVLEVILLFVFGQRPHKAQSEKLSVIIFLMSKFEQKNCFNPY